MTTNTFAVDNHAQRVPTASTRNEPNPTNSEIRNVSSRQPMDKAYWSPNWSIWGDLPASGQKQCSSDPFYQQHGKASSQTTPSTGELTWTGVTSKADVEQESPAYSRTSTLSHNPWLQREKSRSLEIAKHTPLDRQPSSSRNANPPPERLIDQKDAYAVPQSFQNTSMSNTTHSQGSGTLNVRPYEDPWMNSASNYNPFGWNSTLRSRVSQSGYDPARNLQIGPYNLQEQEFPDPQNFRRLGEHSVDFSHRARSGAAPINAFGLPTPSPASDHFESPYCQESYYDNLGPALTERMPYGTIFGTRNNPESRPDLQKPDEAQIRDIGTVRTSDFRQISYPSVYPYPGPSSEYRYGPQSQSSARLLPAPESLESSNGRLFNTLPTIQPEAATSQYGSVHARPQANDLHQRAAPPRHMERITNADPQSRLEERSVPMRSGYGGMELSVFSPERSRQSHPPQMDVMSNIGEHHHNTSYAYGGVQNARMSEMPVYMHNFASQTHGILPNIGLARISEPASGHGFRSALLQDFKSHDKSGRHWELRDIYGHIVEFSGDQNGSRFIQDKLTSANSDERNRVFSEILPNALQLMMDVFGNYVIQRYFELGDQGQKRFLVSKMKGHVLKLSTHVYGCRAVQSALGFVLVEQQVSLVKELEPENNILKCVKDQNGNHVIQVAIESVPSQHMPFVINAFLGQVRQLAMHAYGCRIVQRLLKHWPEPGKSRILDEVHACAPALISDQYGNYVIQYILENEAHEDCQKMINVVRSQIVSFARQKFASNVVEKCLNCGTEEQRRTTMLQLCKKDNRGESPLRLLIRDAYGNYVIQTLLDTLNDVNYATFVSMLRPEVDKIKQMAPNKQAENVAKKMHRLDKQFDDNQMYSSGLVHSFHPRGPAIQVPMLASIPTPPSTAHGHRSPHSGSSQGNFHEQQMQAPAAKQAGRPPHYGYSVPGL